MRGSALVWIAAIAGTLLSFAASQVTEWPLVTISSGKIIGRNFTSPFTNTFMYAFQGIPYGAAPVGSNRFKPPEPPANWTYKPYLDCTKDGPVCFQDAGFGLPPAYVMTEDCLNLNVYTSSLTGKMPVMVWIHGGANIGGSGAYDVSAPDMLVAEDVVVVSINYRLGALGFLTLGTADAPGNAALHDQILALQWVQTNIKQFGGDPTQVTIWGESSGSTCVHLLYMSPMAKGLFQGAIAESGTALVNAVWKDGSSYGYDLARALNCNHSSDPAETLKCLQMVPATDIINAQSNNVSVSYEDTVNGNWLAWRANVDKGLISQPLLPDMPENLWLQGKTSTVPILLGNVVDEGVVKLIGTSDSEVMNMTDNLQYFVPEKTRNSLSASKLATLTQKIRDFYLPNNSTVSPTNIHPYVNLLGDYMFKYGTSVSARMFKKRQDNVFVFLFNYDGTYKGLGDVLDKKYNTTFIGHGVDLEYLFVPDNLTTPLAPGNPDLLTWQRMARMWANFAKHGYPTLVLDKDPLLQNISWNAVGAGDKTYYLNIGVNLTMVADPYLKDVVALWDPILGGVPTSGSERLQVTALVMAVVAFLRLF